MARLYRPHVPLKVRCMVLARQLGFDPASVEKNKGRYKGLHDTLLVTIALAFGCRSNELRLDHNPALALRQQFKNGRGEIVRYVPDANDAAFLEYRPHGAQHARSHDVKTRIRGEHGQFSDIVLIKRERRRTKEPTAYQKRMAELKAKRRQLRKEMRLRRKLAGKAGKKAKHNWKSRPFRSKKSPERFGDER